MYNNLTLIFNSINYIVTVETKSKDVRKCLRLNRIDVRMSDPSAGTFQFPEQLKMVSFVTS